MDIEKARKLKVGDTVHCPADRGDPAYVGKVKHILPDDPANKNIRGVEYIWVHVKHPSGSSHVWPSNRLG